MMLLEIPRIPPTPNDLLGCHWRHRQRNQKLWRDEVFYAMRAAGYLGERIAWKRAKVTIDRRSRGELDPDNLVACVKPIIDGLRYANVIENDTPQHLELVVTQERTRKLPPRTRIQVEPISTV